MQFLNFSIVFISKFKNNYLISSVKKNLYFCSKNYILQAALASLFSSSCCLSVYKKRQTDFLSSTCGGKRFRETENEYAHKVMENLSSYSSSLLKISFQNESYIARKEKLPTHLNVIDKFGQITLSNVSKGLTLEDRKFIDIVEELCIALPKASDENVQKVLYYLSMWPLTPSVNTQNFKCLWKLLDQECVKRMKSWDVSQKLLIGDYWFHLKLSRVSYYNSALIYNLISDIDSLSKTQVVQLMFYINLQRKIPDHFVPSLERKIESIINFLQLEEVGIICLGFFKTQNKISNGNLIQCIIKQFMNNVENLNTITVVAILKFLRKSLNKSLTDLYILTLHKCVSYLDNFDIPTSVHLALLSSECNVYHPLLLNCVSEKLSREMDNVRIKDCAKFLLCLSLYNHFVEFHELYINELKKENRQNEVFSYPKHFVHTVLYYSYMGYYDYDLLAKVFEKRFVKECGYYFPEIKPTLAEIDYSVEIECPDYKGPKLNVSDRRVLNDRRGNLPTKPQNQNMQTRLLNEICDTIVEVLGSDENVLIRHILPHVYSPDIIVRLSGNMEKSLADLCQPFSTEFILKPPKNEVWAAFVVCATYSFAYKSTHLTAIPTMKLRQLKKIGYFATFIPFFNLPRNISERKTFLKEKLNMLEEQSAVAK